MFLLILNGAASLVIFTGVCKSLSSRKRGTNSVTRFVRGAVATKKLDTYMFVSAALTACTAVSGYLFKAVYACLPSLLLFAFIIVNKYKQDTDTQAIEDARKVTKSSLKPVAASAPIVGGVAGGAVAGPVGVAAGAAAGALVSAGALTADANMDVDVEEVEKEDFEEVADLRNNLLTISTEAAFIAAAQRAGIPTDGRSLTEIAENVIDNAPSAMISELPDNMSIEDKAMTILGDNG